MKSAKLNLDLFLIITVQKNLNRYFKNLGIKVVYETIQILKNLLGNPNDNSESF